MLSGVVWGQYPEIEPLEKGQYLFENLKLKKHPASFDTASTDCAFSYGDTYKYFSFKANFDMVFAFDLIAPSSNYRFLVWKVSKNYLPTVIFDRGSTINPDRSVQGSSVVKGMKEGIQLSCESIFELSSTGYVKAFEGSDLLKKDETIVIAVYGPNETDNFGIKINVAEERTITTFNYLCFGNFYTYQQVYDAVVTDVNTKPNPVPNPTIKLYRDNTLSTEVTLGATFNSDTTIYAQVKDVSGDTKYIYTIPLKFIPEHQFNFKPTIETEYACTPTYTIPDEDELLNKLFPTVDSNYSISSIVIDGTSYTSGQNVNLAVGQTTSMKIKVHYGGGCPIDSHEVSIPLKQGSPVLSSIEPETTCKDEYRINFDNIYTKLNINKNQYDLIVTLGGITILDGESTPITTTSPLNYQVKIKSKSGGACESEPVNFIVTKTSPANILPAEIKDICLADFTQSNIDNAISIIQNGNSYNLKFYQEDGLTEITDLLAFIKTTKNGKIIVKALAVDNGNTICDTDVELNFSLDDSTFIKVDNIPTLNSTCAEVGAGYMFAKAHIESYLKTVLGTSVSAFQGISDETLSDNQSKTIRFKVKINGENCFSEEMILKLQVITKPNVTDTTQELTADCDDKITIDDQVLSNLFGANSIIDYDSEILHNNSTPLIFVGGKATIKVRFKNKLDNSCFVEKEIIINEKQDLIVDVLAVEMHTQDHEIIYCEDNPTTAKNQIQSVLDYIKLNYPTLVTQSSVDEIYAKFTSNNDFVEVVFNDPNYCGIATIKFYYKINTLPTITVSPTGEVCSGDLYNLDFTTQTDYDKYYYEVEKEDGTRILGTYIFELDAGNYKITIEDKLSGCSIVKTLVVSLSELPTIEKITINEKSVIVSAKGNGKLEYALFDSDGKVIVDWQTKNELIIPDNIKNNDFTVRVRLNNCGVSERKNVIYLALPNVVTPNNDGFNDVWQPMTKDGKVTDTSNSYKLIIFDRYGKQILTQEGTDIIKWDGTLNGKPVADGTYWYLLEFSKQSDDLQVLYSGSILVKRKIK